MATTSKIISLVAKVKETLEECSKNREIHKEIEKWKEKHKLVEEIIFKKDIQDDDHLQIIEPTTEKMEINKLKGRNLEFS